MDRPWLILNKQCCASTIRPLIGISAKMQIYSLIRKLIMLDRIFNINSIDFAVNLADSNR